MSDPKHEEDHELRVEHVFAALDQIEELSRRVRRALAGLDPKMALTRDAHEPPAPPHAIGKCGVAPPHAIGKCEAAPPEPHAPPHAIGKCGDAPIEPKG